MSWLVGRLRMWMIARGWDDPATHVVFMLLLPFAAYVLAERLGVSGILSAVAAGMMQSWLDLLPRQTSTRLLNRSVWSLLEFAFNGLIFLLLGLQLPDIVKAVVTDEATVWPTLAWRCLDVVAIFAALILLRFVWVQSIWRAIGVVRRWRGKPELVLLPTARSCWLLTLGGVRGAVTLAGVMSIPLLMGAGKAFPERDLLIFIAAGVILLSLICAVITLPILLRGVTRSPDDRLRQEVQEAWRRTAEAAIHALEAEEVIDANAAQDATQATMATELKARLMAEYRDELDSYNDSAEARPWPSRWTCWNVACVYVRCAPSGLNCTTCIASTWWAMKWCAGVGRARPQRGEPGPSALRTSVMGIGQAHECQVFSAQLTVQPNFPVPKV